MIWAVFKIFIYFLAFYGIAAYMQVCPCSGPVRAWSRQHLTPIADTLNSVKEQEISVNALPENIRQQVEELGLSFDDPQALELQLNPEEDPLSKRYN